MVSLFFAITTIVLATTTFTLLWSRFRSAHFSPESSTALAAVSLVGLTLFSYASMVLLTAAVVAQ